LDSDDGLGTCQSQRQTRIVFLKSRHFGGERVGFGGLWAALGRRQCTKGASSALPTPVGQRRGVEALAAQNGGDAAGVSRAIRVSENAQFVLGGEDAAVRASRELG